MPVESAADRAVFVNPDEFGALLTWEGAGEPIPALAQTGTLLIGTQDGPAIQTKEASFVVDEADLPAGHGQGDLVTVAGIAHQVVSIEPDGTGMALVRLEVA